MSAEEREKAQLESPLYWVREISIYGAIYATSIFGLIAWFSQRRQQPMKSRLYVPAISSISLFITAVYYSVNLALYLSRTINISTRNIISPYGYILYDVSYIASIFSYIGLTIQFIAFQNLSLIRNQYLKNAKNFKEPRTQELKEETKRMEQKAKRYQFFLSQKFLIGGLVVILILFTPISVTISIGIHLLQWSFVARTVNFSIWLGILVVIAIVVIVVDLAMNRKYWCRPYLYFIDRDRLQFRTDVLIAVVLIPIILQGQIIKALGYDFPTKPYFYFIWVSEIARVSATYLILYGGTPFWNYTIARARFMVKEVQTRQILKGFASTSEAENIEALKPRNRKSQALQPVVPEQIVEGNEELLKVLMDEEGFKMMKSFVDGEYSTENIECWNSIQQVQKDFSKKTNSQRFQILVDFNETYVKPGAILEVNVTHETREELGRILATAQKEGIEITTDMLKPLLGEASRNLMDSFQRFKKTVQYLQFVTDYEFKKKNMALGHLQVNPV